MASPPETNATDLVLAHRRGDPQAAAELLPLVYDRLRRLAAHYMKGERPGHTLQPTALVHEAYLRLIELDRIDWQGKTHFYAMAARQMRRVLCNHARDRNARKRGGQLKRVTLPQEIAELSDRTIELVALDEALAELAHRFQRQAHCAELHLFGGLSDREVAHVLDVSETTAKQDWRFARAWLARRLRPQRENRNDTAER